MGLFLAVTTLLLVVAFGLAGLLLAQFIRVERSFVFGVINRQIGWVLCRFK